MLKKILISCPPMLKAIETFRPEFARHGMEIVTPNITQTLSVPELIELLPQFDGWIIGDDPATAEVFAAGRAGRLRAAVKWGVGVDNVDFIGARAAGIEVINTPGMFGREVADIAVGYVIALARQTFAIDAGVRQGAWPKPPGISLAGKNVALLGFGDIGQNTARRLLACDLSVTAYDPYFKPHPDIPGIFNKQWPQDLHEADFIVLTCALTSDTRHILNANSLARCKAGVRVVNVSRGPLIDEQALVSALHSGQVHSAALEVAETEPLPENSPLRQFNHRVLFGSHNASNTREAVERTSYRAIDLLAAQFGK